MPINLLPLSEKLFLKQRDFFKCLLLFFSFCLFCLVLFWSFIFVLRVYITAESAILEETAAAKENFLKSGQFDNFLGQVKIANQNLVLVNAVWEEQFYIADLINHLAGLSGGRIVFNQFSFLKNYDPKKDYLAEVEISGTALKREDLLKLQKTLRDDPNFKDVYFTPFSWVNPEDAAFHLSFFIKYDDKK